MLQADFARQVNRAGKACDKDRTYTEDCSWGRADNSCQLHVTHGINKERGLLYVLQNLKHHHEGTG